MDYTVKIWLTDEECTKEELEEKVMSILAKEDIYVETILVEEG